MSESHFLSFDLPVDDKGVASYTWTSQTVGRPLRISAVAVMIEHPTSLEARTVCVEIMEIKKAMAAFLGAGGAIIQGGDLNVDAPAKNCSNILEGCRCVPPIESSCNDCPPQKPIAVGPIDVSLFQLILTIEKLKPNVSRRVSGKLAVLYDPI
jgi:hypothetical protein